MMISIGFFKGEDKHTISSSTLINECALCYQQGARDGTTLLVVWDHEFWVGDMLICGSETSEGSKDEAILEIHFADA